ncbi:MAG TPA: hypothetical protein VI461_11715 [Chitinophagaceae bacterium]|nr:hypothetical protein [Chitinophagaceae bacterium]
MPENGVFDLFCFGHPRKSADDLITLVRNKDHKTLNQLASSLSLYERIFGTAGLFFIQLSGEKLTPEEEKLILLNQESDLTITTCSDHVVSHGQPMSKYLENNYLKALYKAIYK